MAISIDYDAARSLLAEMFAEAEAGTSRLEILPDIVEAADKLFASSSQSIREVTLGCGIARIIDRNINIRLPYSEHGKDAFNGRSLDEQVINPFLHDKAIPSSKGPYLAMFRRSVKLNAETASGV